MKIKRSAICALVSGGLDSCVLLAELSARRFQVHPLFVRQGLLWEPSELRHLRRFLLATRLPRVGRLTLLDLPMRDLYRSHWSLDGHRVPSAASPDAAVYLPGRNLLLLTKAAVFCAQQGIPRLALGSLGQNPFTDASPQFFREFSTVASRGLGFRLQILTPFRRLTKVAVIRRGAGLPLHLSFSCLAPRKGWHCGRCNKCAERHRAFLGAGVPDPTRYFARA